MTEVEAKSFAQLLKIAAENDDRSVFTALLAPRIHVNGDTIARTDASKKINAIINDNVLQSIRDANADGLWANSEGCMIGNGTIWFGPQGHGEPGYYLVIKSINNRIQQGDARDRALRGP